MGEKAKRKGNEGIRLKYGKRKQRSGLKQNSRNFCRPVCFCDLLVDGRGIVTKGNFKCLHLYTKRSMKYAFLNGPLGSGYASLILKKSF